MVPPLHAQAPDQREWDYRKLKTIDREERNDRIEARERYRLKPKGRPDIDGYQRYFVPELGDEDYENLATAEIFRPPQLEDRFHPRDSGPQVPTDLPYLSDKWVKHYEVRSTVEAANGILKSGHHEDIGNPYKRPGRGYAYQYLMTTLAVVSVNIRKLKSFVDRHEAPRNPKSPERRERRRRPELR